jgi:RsiW-degrading membrane proteinase PrsW (M82 family)
MMGYYYGLSYFSTPILRAQKTIIWPRMMEKIFGIDDEKIYSIQNLVQGFLIAASLHAVFNVFLEMEWTFLLVPFLIIGYMYLTYLFEKKENNKKFGYLTTHDSSPASNVIADTVDAIIG